MSDQLQLPPGVLYDHQGNLVVGASSYGGQDRIGPELSGWQPMMTAPDDEVMEGWETSVGRLRELINENGITSGMVQTHLDQIIGPELKLVCKPDYRALGLSREWAEEFAQQVEPAFRNWAFDPGYRCHASRTLDFTGILRQGQRSKIAAGEICATAEWVERGAWPYRTAIQPLDPERLATPAGQMDGPRLRSGVVKDQLGAPTAYWVREGHPNDMADSQAGSRFKRVPRETEWGRQVFIHIFDQQRPMQSRGRSGLLPAIKQIKMLERWQGTSMQAAIINSMYAAVIKSSVQHPEVMQALGSGSQNPISAYMAQALSFHKGTNKVQWDGSKIAHLFPGEELEMLSAKQPVAAFEQFERAALRGVAAAGNISYEQLSKDYTNTTYSSARASMLEAWKYILSERQHTAIKLANQIYTLWLEDAIDAGEIELPAGAPSFYDPGSKRAYCQAKWIGPGRDQIDPVKDARATEMELSMSLTTHEEEAARRGRDFDEILDEQVATFNKMLAKGVPEETARRLVWGRHNVRFEEQDAEAQDTAERNERDAA